MLCSNFRAAIENEVQTNSPGGIYSFLLTEHGPARRREFLARWRKVFERRGLATVARAGWKREWEAELVIVRRNARARRISPGGRT
jgi:hypothetical protein